MTLMLDQTCPKLLMMLMASDEVDGGSGGKGDNAKAMTKKHEDFGKVISNREDKIVC